MRKIIKIENLCVRFRIYRNKSFTLKEAAIGLIRGKTNTVQQVREFDALKDVNLTIEDGDRIGIIGLNGAGKSTLLRAIVGIYPPHSGRITVEGQITPLIELGTGFDSELSGRENIYLNGALLRRSRQEMEKSELDIIEFAELGEFIDMPVKYYSSGMYSRLAFSIGTRVEPEILLLDEVLASGDAHFVQRASAHLTQLLDRSSIVVMVSHDLGKMVEICNRAVVIHKGKIVNQGKPEDMACFYMDHIAAGTESTLNCPV